MNSVICSAVRYGRLLAPLRREEKKQQAEGGGYEARCGHESWIQKWKYEKMKTKGGDVEGEEEEEEKR